MAINNIMQAPINFQALYRCQIEPTGEQIYNVPNSRDNNKPLTLMEKMVYASEKEIAIKMPETDYLRFMENWNMYMQIITASHQHPEIREQFQHLMIMANMLK
jgi:hypothetical protein